MNGIELSSSEAEQAMLRAQERARAYVASPIAAQPSRPTDTDDSSYVLNPPLTSNNSSKSSLKIRPGLQRINSEPTRKSVHFSTTNLVDVRKFKHTQRPSAVRLNSDKARFYYASSQGEYFSDDEDEEEDDDENNEDGDDRYSVGENCESDSSDFLSAVCGLDEDGYDEEGISFSPVLKARRKTISGISKNRKDSNTSAVTLKGWTLLTPGFVPHANVRVSGKHRPIVYLENLQFLEENMEIKATAFVRNIAYDKFVSVRYSVNGWRSYGESQGIWSDDIRKFDRENNYDRFDVIIPLNLYSAELLNSTSIEICVQYSSNGEQFWDNNNGKNYQIFLRHQKLSSSKPNKSAGSVNGHTSSKPSPTKTNGPSKNNSNLSLKFRTFSYPNLSHAEERLRDLSISIDTESSLENIALTDFSNGNLSKQSEDAKLNDPFVNRYSFNASYNSSSNNSQSGLSKQAAIGFPSDRYPPESQPLQIKASPEGRRPENKAWDQGEGESQPKGAWESQSYKEFVSKYCFFTPQPTHQQKVNSPPPAASTIPTPPAATTTTSPK